MTNNEQLFQTAQQLLVGGVNSPVRAYRGVGGTPILLAKGKGPHVYDTDGNEYVDYVAGYGPAILGHAHEAVVAAVARAAADGFGFGATHPLELELAQLICSALPGVERLRFTSSGTEAVMTAIRLARGYTRRRLILKFAGCYHGHSDALLVKSGSGAATLGQPDSAGIPEEVTAMTMICPYNDLDSVRELAERHGEDLACIIVEPVVGNMGVILPEPGFLAGLRQVCDATGALLLFDEVITGFRLGWQGAQGLFGIRPDLTILGKIIGGGLPVGAVGGPAAIMEHLAPLGPVYQAGTLSGNPLAMACGLATLTTLQALDPYARLAAYTKALASELVKLAAEAGLAVNCNQAGSLFSLFFTDQPVCNAQQAEAASRAIFQTYFHGMAQHGVLLAPSPFEAAFVSAAHDQHTAGRTLSAARHAFAACRAAS
jgi:glutamate-1-semialdehyde 2,1-aminomutase